MHTLLVDVEPLNLSFSVLQPPGKVPRSSTCRYIKVILLLLRHRLIDIVLRNVLSYNGESTVF